MVLQNKKDSVTRCVPSSSSGDFCFFLFRFAFGVSSTRTKSKKGSISKNRFTCHNITSLPGFYKTKKALQQGAYLPPAQVISAFSFFVFLLEFLLREQKAAKVQFLRTAWYATIIKSQYLGFTKQKRFCNKVRTFLQLRWFLLFPISFFFWSFFYENKKQRKINFSETLYMSPLKSFYPGFTKQIGFATEW